MLRLATGPLRWSLRTMPTIACRMRRREQPVAALCLLPIDTPATAKCGVVRRDATAQNGRPRRARYVGHDAARGARSHGIEGPVARGRVR